MTEHTCTREQRGLPLINSGFLAREYLGEFRINPSWPIKAFHNRVLKDLQLDVHLGNMTCGCKKWDLCGIPCQHAISCLNRLGYSVEDYVDKVYTTNNYKKAYSGIIYPMNGHMIWEKSGLVMKPPTVEKQPGRPKKRRRLEMPNLVEKESEGVKSLSKKTQLTVRY